LYVPWRIWEQGLSIEDLQSSERKEKQKYDCFKTKTFALNCKLAHQDLLKDHKIHLAALGVL